MWYQDSGFAHFPTFQMFCGSFGILKGQYFIFTFEMGYSYWELRNWLSFLENIGDKEGTRQIQFWVKSKGHY